MADERRPALQIGNEPIGRALFEEHFLVVAGKVLATNGVRVGHLCDVVGEITGPVLDNRAEFNLPLAGRPTSGADRLGSPRP